MAHCPKSNAKLGCGVAPLADLLHEGVRVGFGTDSPASSNIMDMFDEMRTMLFLHRAIERDVSVLDAQQCVRHRHAGRRRGARHGRAASAASSPASSPTSSPSTFPARTSRPIDDPYSALVYGANQDDVFWTWSAGRRRLPRPRPAHPGLDAAASAARPSRCARSCGRRVREGGARGRRRIRLVASGPNRSHPRRSKEKACSSIADVSSSGRSGSSRSWPSSWPAS